MKTSIHTLLFAAFTVFSLFFTSTSLAGYYIYIPDSTNNGHVFIADNPGKHYNTSFSTNISTDGNNAQQVGSISAAFDPTTSTPTVSCQTYNADVFNRVVYNWDQTANGTYFLNIYPCAPQASACNQGWLTPKTCTVATD